jgi:glucose-fructose oxidoreductase
VPSEKLRYAVVGLGHIAQVAVLPAFAHARRNSELAALVSGDPVKRAKLARRYAVPAVGYEDLDELLAGGSVDAVYLAVPNHLHCEFAVRAAQAGVHVLCEKPLAVRVDECDRMIRAAAESGVKLMVAYRLHFEAANLAAISIAQSGRLGELRLFESLFAMQVKPGNVRLVRVGGGPLYDLGVYCVNAARYVLRAEPETVIGARVDRPGDPRFRDVEESFSAILRFPGERLATFTCSFGSADVSSYRVVGTHGELRVEPAYEYHGPLAHTLTRRGRSRRRQFAARDQFAPELLHFSDAVLAGREPVPNGVEGRIDVQILCALHESAANGSAEVRIDAAAPSRRPSPRLERRAPAVRKPALVRVESASR